MPSTPVQNHVSGAHPKGSPGTKSPGYHPIEKSSLGTISPGRPPYRPRRGDARTKQNVVSDAGIMTQ